MLFQIFLVFSFSIVLVCIIGTEKYVWKNACEARLLTWKEEGDNTFLNAFKTCLVT